MTSLAAKCRRGGDGFHFATAALSSSIRSSSSLFFINVAIEAGLKCRLQGTLIAVGHVFTKYYRVLLAQFPNHRHHPEHCKSLPRSRLFSSDAAMRAVAQVHALVQQQASILAFLDCFWLLGLVAFIGPALAIFIHKFNQGGGAAAH